MARCNGPPTVSSQPTRINERKEQRHYEGYQLWGGDRMSELTTFNEGSALARDARRFGREISRGRLGTQIRTSQVDNATDVTLAKVENLTMATGNAMQQITRVSQAQRQLEMIAPDAAQRLAFIADDHMLGCAELLSDLRRDLHRIR